MINQITSTVLKQYNSLLQERADVATSSAKSQPPPQVTSFSPESSIRVVNDNVIDKIDKELAKNNVGSVRQLDPKNFTPESVAKGILQFVQNAISRAKARGQATDNLLNQAKIGIEKGFAEAKNILTGLHALSGQIAEGVQQTYDLIQVGLTEIEQAQISGNDVNFESAIQAASQQSQSNSQSFNLTIQTQDGDDVKVQLTQNQSQNEYFASVIKNTETNVVVQSDTNSSSNIQLSVSGNLDKAEVEAIRKLLADVKTVSDRFFSGEVNAAFEAGLSLGFDTKEIASFALTLNENQTQTASRAYREVSNYGNENSRVSPTQLENLLKPARDFMTSFKNNVESNTSDIEGLFNYFAKTNSNNSQQIDRLENLTTDSFENLTKQLLSASQ